MREKRKTLKILAVDDIAENLNLLEHFIRRQQYEIVKASNGLEAIELFQSENPDLILMDVMMPEMDGYEATRRIRELAGDHWIPIIFMSAMTATQDQIEGLNAGGDDYLIKPVTLKILAAKITAMQRIADMREALAKQAAELAMYRKDAEEEKYFANQLMGHMTRAGEFADEMLDSWMLPAEHMNGDLVAACRTKDNKLFCMVADATGHGLLAAIMQLPVSQAFYDMTAAGYSLASIVTAMNTRLRQLLPRDRFVAATLAMVDQRNQVIEIWNGGAPDALLVNDDREIVQRFTSNATPLGITPEEIFEPYTQIYQWQEAGELVLYSDGAVDALNADDEPFGEARLEQVLQQSHGQRACSFISQALREHLQGQSAQDDISVVSVKCLSGFVQPDARR